MRIQWWSMHSGSYEFVYYFAGVLINCLQSNVIFAVLQRER